MHFRREKETFLIIKIIFNVSEKEERILDRYFDIE